MGKDYIMENRITFLSCKKNFFGFTAKAGFAIGYEDEIPCASSQWQNNDEIYIYRKENNEWVGRWCDIDESWFAKRIWENNQSDMFPDFDKLNLVERYDILDEFNEDNIIYYNHYVDEKNNDFYFIYNSCCDYYNEEESIIVISEQEFKENQFPRKNESRE
jgi:hypothetical protein